MLFLLTIANSFHLSISQVTWKLLLIYLFIFTFEIPVKNLYYTVVHFLSMRHVYPFVASEKKETRQERRKKKNDRKFMVEYITASIVGNLKPSSDAWITRQYFLFRFLFFACLFDSRKSIHAIDLLYICRNSQRNKLDKCLFQAVQVVSYGKKKKI